MEWDYPNRGVAGWFGVAAIILGIVAMMTPGLTGISVMTILGLLALGAGILRIIWAFQAGSIEKGIFTFAVGALTILAGIGLLAHPLFAAGFISILLAAYFILDGIAELLTGLHAGRGGRLWWFFGGTISILLGVAIWAQFPLSGLWAVGILLGIKLFLIGLIMVTAGNMMESMTSDA